MIALVLLLAPTAIGRAVPDHVGGTATVQLLADATHGAVHVRCNLSAIGEAANQIFFDDGGHGDGAAGDLEFGYVAYVTGGTPVGDYAFACTVADALGDTSSFSIALTVIPACGDGIVQAPEECDDDGTESADGCDATCHVEAGWTCSGSPSRCTTLCGDGLVVGGEGCDDGNHTPGDGCASCQVEPGWSCSGAPSTCVRGALCGNGVIEAGEQCDDGNADSGDGCDATCTIEDGFTCTGAPSACCPVTGCDAGVGVDAGAAEARGGGCCDAGGDGAGSTLAAILVVAITGCACRSRGA